VDGVGDQLLAGAGFAADQDCCRPFGDHADLVEDAQHGRRMANEVAEARAVANGAALRIALLVERPALLRGFERQADALADQVGEQLDKADALVEQTVVLRIGLHRENALQRPAEMDGHGDEGQIPLVQAEPVEEARILAQSRDRAGPAAFEDAAEQTLAGPVADRLEIVVIEAMHGVDTEVAAVWIDNGDHAPAQMAADLQRAQHFAQALRRIERARE